MLLGVFQVDEISYDLDLDFLKPDEKPIENGSSASVGYFDGAKPASTPLNNHTDANTSHTLTGRLMQTIKNVFVPEPDTGVQTNSSGSMLNVSCFLFLPLLPIQVDFIVFDKTFCMLNAGISTQRAFHSKQKLEANIFSIVCFVQVHQHIAGVGGGCGFKRRNE